MSLLLAGALGLALGGCVCKDCAAAADTGGGEDGAGGEGGDGGTTDPPDPSGQIALGDVNNYRFEGYLDGPGFPAAELADVRVDWSEVSQDFQCHDMDPATEVDNVALLVFPYLSEEEVEAGLSQDDIEQSELGVYLTVEPEDGVTSASLSDFTFFGTEAKIQEEFDEGSGTWLVLFTTGTTVGVGSRMIAFLRPDASAGATSVEVPQGCGVLDWSADLARLQPVAALPEGPWLVDWSALTEDGRGGELVLGDIDELMVGRYRDLSPADLQAQFLDIEQLADGLWRLDPGGAHQADLAGLLSDEGQPFPGFDDPQATWVLALRCNTCSNPAPPFLTVVQPWAE